MERFFSKVEADRCGLRKDAALILADYLAGQIEDITVGRLVVVMGRLQELPSANRPAEELGSLILSAHRRNKDLRRECGCKQYRKCRGIPQVSLTDLRHLLDRDNDQLPLGSPLSYVRVSPGVGDGPDEDLDWQYKRDLRLASPDTKRVPFNKFVAQLAKFIRRYGDANPAQTQEIDGYPVGAALDVQRQRYYKGTLHPERYALLVSMGVLFDSEQVRAHGNASPIHDRGPKSEHDRKLSTVIAAAQDYFAVNGDLDVPYGYVAENMVKLGRLLSDMRTARRDVALEPWVQEELNHLGMIWEPTTANRTPSPAQGRQVDTAKWMAALGLLIAYRELTGMTFPPQDYHGPPPSIFALGQWVTKQKGRYRNGTLSRDRQEAWLAAGFAWDGPRQRR
ncbi:helicase associated domain-containing protein [Tessaracoccus sp.]